MPDHPSERTTSPHDVAARSAARPDARRACPRCGAALGALRARSEAPAESLYCGCCGLVLPAA